jgi:hypothetical protein
MGRRSIPWWAVLTLTLAGACGDGSDAGAAHVSFAKPIPAGLNCIDQQFAFTGLEVAAYIAGHARCDLDVDESSHEASGSCPGITVGVVRPVLIVYTRPKDVASGAATLAYAIGAIDLREESLPSDPNEAVTTTLDSSALVVEQANIDAIEIPNDDCRQRDASVPEQWAKCWIRDELHTSLLCGTSTVPNLVRACAGTLSCPQI